ncbi:limonene-1,2-epoxide hydrolase [Mycobacterium sp. Aquia_216]|uniref:limonene-1,2-epoxide hydrolase family protein n=1 Tax=Mycobacterium sp. Aquia_216 TaxID=2991729 RepID=UPI00227A6369|nr:limonene-1,2-epoxide hydrolase family protein [Mycobacterium sp. Aquia_216]WAJ46641.1 limonene-1,2-epoxide hydrolase [Mycobacterium sp. Aquia_216]
MSTNTTIDARPDQHELRVLGFFAAWGESFDAMCASFDLLAAECVWDQRPIPKLTGPGQAVRFLRIAHRVLGLATIDVEILGIASKNDVVHTARVDRLRRADGTLIAAAPVAGMLTFGAGKITHWREYFDATGFLAQTVATTLTHPVRQLGRSRRS